MSYTRLQDTTPEQPSRPPAWTILTSASKQASCAKGRTATYRTLRTKTHDGLCRREITCPPPKTHRRSASERHRRNTIYGKVSPACQGLDGSSVDEPTASPQSCECQITTTLSSKSGPWCWLGRRTSHGLLRRGGGWVWPGLYVPSPSVCLPLSRRLPRTEYRVPGVGCKSGPLVRCLAIARLRVYLHTQYRR